MSDVRSGYGPPSPSVFRGYKGTPIYIDLEAGKLFFWRYEEVFELAGGTGEGEPGPQGDRGEAGANGADGVDGAPGEDGKDGVGISSGSGNPSSSPASGTLYVNVANGDLWRYD